jgi:hypothetical protein
VRGLKARVRRITDELGPIGAATAPGVTADGRVIREQVIGGEGDPVLTVGDTLDAVTGSVQRCGFRKPHPRACDVQVLVNGGRSSEGAFLLE